jgi:hypothetical protein
MERARVNAQAFLDQACQLVLGQRLDEVSLTAFIRDNEARRVAEAPSTAWANGDADEAMASLRLAFDRLVRDYEQCKVWHQGRSLFTTSPAPYRGTRTSRSWVRTSFLSRGQFMGFGRVDAGTLRPRRPLLVTDAAGGHPPIGWFAVGNAAVWIAAFEDRRVWRVPLAGGPARAVTRVPSHAYGLAADDGAVWVVSARAEPGSGGDGSGRLRRLDRRTGVVTASTPLPDVDFGRDGVAVGLALGGGAVWLAGPSSRRSEASGVLLRVDSVSGRVTGWLRDPRWFLQDVLAAGPRGAWVATATPELLHVLAA